jgi:hypothetical protein
LTASTKDKVLDHTTKILQTSNRIEKKVDAIKGKAVSKKMQVETVTEEIEEVKEEELPQKMIEPPANKDVLSLKRIENRCQSEATK